MMSAVVIYGDFLLKGSEVKRSFDENYLRILFAQHADLDKSYIIDFLHQAQLSGANPAQKQIHLTKYFSKKLGRMIGVAVHSYHFFLNQANQTGSMRGLEVSTALEDVFNPITGKMSQELVSTAIVEREGRGKTVFKARWSEFYNAMSENWRTKPYVMLEKTAIANVLRWAFPETLSGMFIDEEISEENYEDVFKVNDPSAIDVLSKKADDRDKVMERSEHTKDITVLADAIKILLGEVKTSSIKDKTDLLKKLYIKNIDELYKKSLAELTVDRQTLIDLIQEQNTKLIPKETPVVNQKKFEFQVSGDTVNHKAALKAMGGRWNAHGKCWDFDSNQDSFDKIRQIAGLDVVKTIESNSMVG